MSGSHEHLVYMANQIARNFATMRDIDAVAATADHIAKYWEPRMRASVMKDGAGLSPIARQAVALLNLQQPASRPIHGVTVDDAG